MKVEPTDPSELLAVAPDRIGRFGEVITCGCDNLTIGPVSGPITEFATQCQACGEHLTLLP